MTTITLEGKEYQLDIEQAEKLGLLKEKDSRVRSWEEFQIKYSYPKLHRTEIQLYAQETTALAAFSKLLKLRRDWIGEWEPDWDVTTEVKAVIILYNNVIDVSKTSAISHPLSFPNYNMAREFLETFRDLIEEAKILI